jgi:hypothetical protein
MHSKTNSAEDCIGSYGSIVTSAVVKRQALGKFGRSTLQVLLLLLFNYYEMMRCDSDILHCPPWRSRVWIWRMASVGGSSKNHTMVCVGRFAREDRSLQEVRKSGAGSLARAAGTN